MNKEKKRKMLKTQKKQNHMHKQQNAEEIERYGNRIVFLLKYNLFNIEVTT